MSAPFVTSLRNPITPPAVTVSGEAALATLKRGIRGGVGTLWERAEESGADLVTINGWLCVDTGEHNCAGGFAAIGYAHEPGCGLEPIYQLRGTS